MSKIKLFLFCLFVAAIVAAFLWRNRQIEGNRWFFFNRVDLIKDFNQLNHRLYETYRDTYSSDPKVRGYAASDLINSHLLGVDFAPAIHILQSDPSDEARLFAASSMDLSSSEGLPERTRLQVLSVLLKSMTEDRSARVRDGASYNLLNAIHIIGENKENVKFRIKAFELARPFFDKALKDKDKRVRDNARGALWIIHGNPIHRNQ